MTASKGKLLLQVLLITMLFYQARLGLHDSVNRVSFEYRARESIKWYATQDIMPSVKDILSWQIQGKDPLEFEHSAPVIIVVHC